MKRLHSCTSRGCEDFRSSLVPSGSGSFFVKMEVPIVQGLNGRVSGNGKHDFLRRAASGSCRRGAVQNVMVNLLGARDCRRFLVCDSSFMRHVSD